MTDADHTLAETGPYEAYITGEPAGDDGWAHNSVSVSPTTTWTDLADPAAGDDDADWADGNGARQLVRIATGYKPGREENPVLLSRLAAVDLVDTILQVLDETFHYSRVGRLRAGEAAELLTRLEDLDHQLAELRSHALGDLRAAAGLSVTAHEEAN